MPTFLPLTPVPEKDLPRIPGLPVLKQLKTTFPKRALPGQPEARAAIRTWQGGQLALAVPKNPEVPVRGVQPTTAALAKLRAVIDSETAPTEMMNQKLAPEAFFGTLYSALVVFEYMRLESEYRQRARVRTTLAKTEREWAEALRAMQAAFAAGGLKGVTPAEMARYAKDLTSNRKTLDAITRVANSAVLVDTPAVRATVRAIKGAFVPIDGSFVDISATTLTVPDLCDEPIAQGTFTKFFSKSFSLTVRLYVPCPTWTNPFRWCWKNFTIAGVSFSMGVTVGYRVNCCGATVWGQAYAQACGTILGIRVCAGCSATITGVAGVSRTPVAGNCNYGLGASAALKCTLAGATVFYASVPFGFVVTGPCPPAGLCD